MKIMSTMISNKSTDGSNHSSAGSNQSIHHVDTPNPDPVAPRGNPGKFAIKPELPYDTKQGTTEASSRGVKMGSFTPHNSRTTKTGMFEKHPFKKSDPACKPVSRAY